MCGLRGLEYPGGGRAAAAGPVARRWPGRVCRGGRAPGVRGPEPGGPQPAGAGAHRDRDRRTGSGLGRRSGDRLGGVAGRRPGDRQVDLAAAGVRVAGRGAARALCQRRGVPPADRAARPPAGAHRGGHPAARRDLRGARARPGRARAAAGDGGGLDPDPLYRSAAIGPRLGQPGARDRGAIGALRQAGGYGGLPGRSCDQGWGPGRSAGAGAHGRYRAVLRGGVRGALPAGAGDQEPLRGGQRVGRLRHGRPRPARGQEPLGDLPLAARSAGARAA